MFDSRGSFGWCQLQLAAVADALSRHISSVHEGIKYDCEVCQKRYTSKNNLKYHMEVAHENADLYKCEFCEKNFITKEGFRHHLKICNKFSIDYNLES